MNLQNINYKIQKYNYKLENANPYSNTQVYHYKLNYYKKCRHQINLIGGRDETEEDRQVVELRRQVQDSNLGPKLVIRGQIPLIINKLTELRVLDCSNINLETLPLEIFELTELKIFNCSNNILRSIPENIIKLSKLEGLDCNNNNLSSLPVGIGGLHSLIFLNCSNNILEKLPSEIGLLSELRILICSNNRLTRLPIEIGRLNNLTQLLVNGNNIDWPSSKDVELTNSEALIKWLRERYGGMPIIKSALKNG
jgi:Leucine-rich repeat (LRR) protein